jgi:hypothetical protein
MCYNCTDTKGIIKVNSAEKLSSEIYLYALLTQKSKWSQPETRFTHCLHATNIPSHISFTRHSRVNWKLAESVSSLHPISSRVMSVIIKSVFFCHIYFKY